VPLGVFLSGGLDSSVLAALVQQRSSRPVICFTAGFRGGNDESAMAAAVAGHIGAEHRLVPIEPPPPELLEEIVWHLDEPIGDPACLPTYLLSREAAREVRVVLTGEGSDETNAGYSKFLRHHLFHDKSVAMGLARRWWPALRHLRPVRERFAHYVPLWSAPDELSRILANDQVDCCRPGSPLHDLGPRLLRHRPDTLALLQAELDACGISEPTMRLLQYSRSVFMREDLLMKVDRMTMAHGLEARVPYLDHRLAEIAAGFDPGVLLRGGRTKAVLRDLSTRLLPPQISRRHQHGFLVPLGDWFRGDFAAFAAGLISPATVRKRGFLDPETAEGLVDRFRTTGEGGRMIWNLVLLELWFRRFID
jgi:asparagine synthase (glutamine-hydrolysing)